MAYLLEPVIEQYIISIPFFILLIQVIVSSVLVLLVAEFLPKVIFSLLRTMSVNNKQIPSSSSWLMY